MLHRKSHKKTAGIYDVMVMEQRIFNFSKNFVCMIKLLLLCMLQLCYYAMIFLNDLLMSMQMVLANINID